MKAVYKPDWANSLLAHNHNYRKCSYCERMIVDDHWFRIQKENGHFLIFDSEICMLGYDNKHGEKPE